MLAPIWAQAVKRIFMHQKIFLLSKRVSCNTLAVYIAVQMIASCVFEDARGDTVEDKIVFLLICQVENPPV